ncbi:MAG: hypothetical protein AVDCRST_MAG76-2546 [uncultured Acidimicrobiales bacterium]|uniref:Uncharacterized protein n=1 Tax=uncultured Acidimicrobiales bacterium TaxID=310071 RepID=A0A6J4IM63_9ACTN|nr:MAG: hypothetical protein AVDCRST_MAG76-2546 [uncultured Acidimicrobiales bacterium]
MALRSQWPATSEGTRAAGAWFEPCRGTRRILLFGTALRPL